MVFEIPTMYTTWSTFSTWSTMLSSHVQLLHGRGQHEHENTTCLSPHPFNTSILNIFRSNQWNLDRFTQNKEYETFDQSYRLIIEINKFSAVWRICWYRPRDAITDDVESLASCRQKLDRLFGQWNVTWAVTPTNDKRFDVGQCWRASVTHLWKKENQNVTFKLSIRNVC